MMAMLISEPARTTNVYLLKMFRKAFLFMALNFGVPTSEKPIKNFILFWGKNCWHIFGFYWFLIGRIITTLMRKRYNASIDTMPPDISLS